jgi:hypothetical protein
MMRRLVPLIVTLLSLACGNEPTSPSSNSQLPPAPPLPPVCRTALRRRCVVKCGIRRICRLQARRCRWLRQAVVLSH